MKAKRKEQSLNSYFLNPKRNSLTLFQEGLMIRLEINHHSKEQLSTNLQRKLKDLPLKSKATHPSTYLLFSLSQSSYIKIQTREVKRRKAFWMTMGIQRKLQFKVRRKEREACMIQISKIKRKKLEMIILTRMSKKGMKMKMKKRKYILKRKVRNLLQ